MHEDPARANAALRGLLAHAPNQVAQIQKELSAAATEASSKRLSGWIADLGSDDFAVREAASLELKRIGAAAVPALEATAKATDSPEVRFRAERLVRRVAGRGDGPPAASIRAMRLARILEKAGSVDAEKLLQEMARGDFGVMHVAGAKSVLARIASRK